MTDTPRRRSVYLRIARIFVLALVGLIAVVYVAQTPLIMQGDPEVRRTPVSMGWDFADIALPVNGHTTTGWWLPVDTPRATILFCHGNDGNIGTRIGEAARFRELGCNVVLFDYGGWGASTGRPSETRVYADTRAMYDWLTGEKGIAPSDILIWGRSFGGGAAADLASQVECAGVVLESTFTSMPEAAFGPWGRTPVGWLIRHRFNSLAKVPSITAPTLVIHSLDDDLYPIAMGRALYDALPEGRKTFLEVRGDHYTGADLSKKKWMAGVEEWLVRHRGVRIIVQHEMTSVRSGGVTGRASVPAS